MKPSTASEKSILLRIVEVSLAFLGTTVFAGLFFGTVGFVFEVVLNEWKALSPIGVFALFFLTFGPPVGYLVALFLLTGRLKGGKRKRLAVGMASGALGSVLLGAYYWCTTKGTLVHTSPAFFLCLPLVGTFIGALCTVVNVMEQSQDSNTRR